jgi:hypothetical protein
MRSFLKAITILAVIATTTGLLTAFSMSERALAQAGSGGGCGTGGGKNCQSTFNGGFGGGGTTASSETAQGGFGNGDAHCGGGGSTSSAVEFHTSCPP